jgi:hypothetical protein
MHNPRGNDMSVKELTEEEVYAIMNSDIKLWEKSTTEAKGVNITKALILPFGIGEMRVEFQGVDNGLKRRAAAEQWGAMVRQRVKDKIDDESITARAKQQAAIRESERESESVVGPDSQHGNGDEATVGLQDQSAVSSPSASGAVQAHAFDAQADQGPQGTDFAARAEWLRGRIGEGERLLKGYRRELRALEAALVIINDGEDE